MYYVLPSYGYYLPGSGYGYGYGRLVIDDVRDAAAVRDAGAVQTPVPSPEPLIETGFLKLEVEPRQTLQIFVDGLYIGTLPDLGDEIELRLGARRIELRAPGYRTLIFDTQIVPDRTIIYRGALEPISGARVQRAPSAPQCTSGTSRHRAPEAPAAPAGAE